MNKKSKKAKKNYQEEKKRKIISVCLEFIELSFQTLMENREK